MTGESCRCGELTNNCEHKGTMLNFDKLIYTSLIEKLTQNQIEEYLLIQNKWEWVSYIIIQCRLVKDFTKKIII